MRRRSFQPNFGVLVGKVEHAAADRQLGVARAAVIHDDRLADHRRAQRIDVPGDRVGSSVDGQIGHGRRAGYDGCNGGCARLVQFGDGGIGATHDHSFG